MLSFALEEEVTVGCVQTSLTSGQSIVPPLEKSTDTQEIHRELSPNTEQTCNISITAGSFAEQHCSRE